MAEGLIALGLLIGLMMASIQSGLWQDKSIQMIAHTTHQTFLKSKGGHVDIRNLEKSIENRSLSAVRTKSEPVSIRSDRIRIISMQLGIVHDQIMATQSATFKAFDHNELFNINRHSYIEVGSGYASTDKNVHQKIVQSDAIWGQAEKVSRPVAKAINTTTSVVDRPWKRSSLDMDWFGKWQGAVPESKLKSFTPLKK